MLDDPQKFGGLPETRRVAFMLRFLEISVKDNNESDLRPGRYAAFEILRNWANEAQRHNQLEIVDRIAEFVVRLAREGDEQTRMQL